MSTRQVLQTRYAEVSELLDQALQLPSAELASFIAKISDAPLRDAVAELLGNTSKNQILDLDNQKIASQLLNRGSPLIGRQFGVFTLKKLIGEGGMSSVFLAERDSENFTQQVAIKILRYGIHDAFEQQRFAQERQILANLNHAGIAQLIDGGVNADGLPWFAMEWVQGQSIIDYANHKHLSIAQRLHLFLKVCDAVDYAHRNLIVHRDIKPNNIWCTENGECKLLDFGIAKLLNEPDQTQTQSRRLTPGFAAPEQFSGAAITTQTDVFQLGQLLHCLLTGQTAVRTTTQSLQAPSVLIKRIEDVASHAAQRSTSVSQWSKLLRGDLDVILDKALRLEPAQRYASVSLLAEDIRHHLQSRPITARKQSRVYLIALFLRRHWLAAGLVGALLASVLIGAGLIWQQSQLRQQAATHAQAQAQRATAIKNFLLQMLESAAPNQAQGLQVKVIDALKQSSLLLQQSTALSSDDQVSVLLTIAQIYRQYADLEQAEKLARLALAQNPEPALRAQANVELGQILDNKGQFESAQNAFSEALAWHDKNPQQPNAHSEALLYQARSFANAAKFDQAQTAAEKALTLDAGSADVLLQARDRALMGEIAFGRGELDLAAEHFQFALDSRSAELGESHTLVATSKHDLGVVLLQKGEADRAIELFEQAIATRSKLLGQTHPQVADSMLNLAAAFRRKRELDKAEPLYRQAAEMLQSSLGDNHPARGNALNSLATLHWEQGRLDDAIDTMAKAIAISETALGQNHPALGTMLNNLAGFKRRAGDLNGAFIAQSRSLSILKEALGDKHHMVAVSMQSMAGIYAAQGKFQLAFDESKKAIEIAVQALGESHLDVALIRLGAAESALNLKQLSTVKDFLEKSTNAVASLQVGDPRKLKFQVLQLRLAIANRECDSATNLLAKIPDTPALAQVGTQLSQLEAQTASCK